MATINALNNASAPFGVTGNLTVTTGNISTTSGNISTASGSVSASTTVTAGTNFVSTAGILSLPTGSSTAGQITIAKPTGSSGSVYDVRIHNYGVIHSSNLFIGQAAGNFTHTGLNNFGLGDEIFAALSSGGQNAGLGSMCLKALTTGSNNNAFGRNAMNLATQAGTCSAFGVGSLQRLLTGNNNTCIATNSGYNYTSSESNNIVIGQHYGTTGESNVTRIGATTDGSTYVTTKTYVGGIYNTAVGATAGVVLSDSAHQLGGLAGAANTIFVGGTKPSFTATPQCTDLTLTGVLKLPTTSSTVGQIQINSVASFHAYGTSSIFVGPNSGNFTFTTANAQYSTAIGVDSLNSITGTNTNLGTQNTAAGYNALGDCTDGSYNVVVGVNSGSSITTGSSNTCVGHNAGYSSATTGSNNTMLGAATGQTLATTDASNILIGSAADLDAGTSNALKIGSGAGTGAGQLNKAWIHGIRGITTVKNDAIAVLVDSDGQLGTVSSSLKLKENIKDMADRTSSIMSLRPVTFSYKTHVNKSVPSYGLIAEEVAEVFPDLVVYDKENHPDTIKYHELPVMILNELQKLAKRVEELEKKLKDKGE